MSHGKQLWVEVWAELLGSSELRAYVWLTLFRDDEGIESGQNVQVLPEEKANSYRPCRIAPTNPFPLTWN